MNRKAKSKIVLVLLILVMFVSALPVCSIAAEPLIYVKSTEAKPGKAVEVEIYMENTPGIVNLILQVEYDSDIFTLTKVIDGGILGTQMHTPNYSLCPYQLTWANDTAPQNFRENGKLATLEFKVSEDAEAKDYEIGVSYDFDNWDIVNFEFEKVRFDVKSGTVTVKNGKAPVKDTTQADATSQSEVTSQAQTTESKPEINNDFDFEIKGDNVIINGYNGKEENLVIADKYEIDGKDYTVSEIADGAFKGNETIKTVKIPETVQKVGDEAFYDCPSLGEVIIDGENTQIGDKAIGYYSDENGEEKAKENFVIKSKPESKAEEYAQNEESITFEINSENTPIEKDGNKPGIIIPVTAGALIVMIIAITLIIVKSRKKDS